MSMTFDTDVHGGLMVLLNDFVDPPQTFMVPKG